MSKGGSIIFDFKGVRDACDAISTDILGPRADKMHDCPCCDQYHYNDEDDNPVDNDGTIRCDYCGGIDKPKQVPEKKLIKDGYMPQPPNCTDCGDGGWIYKPGGSQPCKCPAGVREAQAQAQQAQKNAAPPAPRFGSGGAGSIGQKIKKF